jgi:CheY-like chemotaxis protein
LSRIAAEDAAGGGRLRSFTMTTRSDSATRRTGGPKLNKAPIVLLVEDNNLNRDVIEDVFEFDEVPARLVTAQTAEEAIDLAFQMQPVLILMDIRLPGMDGLEATRRLQADPRTQTIPIWALTAHAMNGDAEQALAAGCSFYVAKPIDAKDLRDRIKYVLPVEAGMEPTSGECAEED